MYLFYRAAHTNGILRPAILNLSPYKTEIWIFGFEEYPSQASEVAFVYNWVTDSWTVETDAFPYPQMYRTSTLVYNL